MKLAWKGTNDACLNLGLHWYGLDNPHAEKPVKAVVISSTLDRAIYRHDPEGREIVLTLTGSEDRADCHCCPKGLRRQLESPTRGAVVDLTTPRMEASAYVDFTVGLPGPRVIRVRY